MRLSDRQIARTLFGLSWFEFIPVSGSQVSQFAFKDLQWVISPAHPHLHLFAKQICTARKGVGKGGMRSFVTNMTMANAAANIIHVFLSSVLEQTRNQLVWCLSFVLCPL